MAIHSSPDRDYFSIKHHVGTSGQLLWPLSDDFIWRALAPRIHTGVLPFGLPLGHSWESSFLGQESVFFLDPQVNLIDTNMWDPALTSSSRMATHPWGHPLGDMAPEGDTVIFPRTTLSLCWPLSDGSISATSKPTLPQTRYTRERTQTKDYLRN